MQFTRALADFRFPSSVFYDKFRFVSCLRFSVSSPFRFRFVFVLALLSFRATETKCKLFLAPTVYTISRLINPRRACAARVTVVGLSVCPLVNISLLERLFVLKTLSHTQRATKVKKYVRFSLKMLRCKARAVPALYG